MQGKENEERYFTIIVTPDDPGKVRQFRFSQKKIYTLVFIFFISVLLVSIGLMRYVHVIHQLSNYDDLLVKENKLTEENLQYKEKTRQLADRISHIEMMAKSVSKLSGIDLDNPNSEAGGIGGFTPEKWDIKNLTSQNIKFLKKLEVKTSSIEKEVVKLDDYLFQQNLFLSYIPTAWPVRGYISSAFGQRIDPVTGKPEFHKGIDISAPMGAKVEAPADGTVIFAGAERGYGYIVIIAHKYGIATRYAHLSSYVVKPGQKVKEGDVIGFVGSTGKATGPHLHYEVRLNNRPVNPIRFLGNTANF